MSEPATTAPATSERLGVVVLAAGEGTRMKSQRPKVLHGFAGRSMLEHVLAAAHPLDPASTTVVVGHGREQVTAHLNQIAPAATAVVQAEQRGTGHAVRIALEQLPPADSDVVLVLLGDTPLLRAETLGQLLELHRDSGAAVTLLTSRLEDPSGLGRVLRTPEGSVERVVEHKDASVDELKVDEVATGVYAFDGALLRQSVTRIGTDNAQGEEYLPDAVAILRADGHLIGALMADSGETLGVNDRVQLARAHAVYRVRLNEKHMRAGVTIMDPATTYIDADVSIEADATILPAVHLLAGSTVATGAVVGPDCSITSTSIGARATVTRSVTDGADVGPDCTVGPFAYLRPGAHLIDQVKVGTFVEIKNSELGRGAKVPHLSYVGDATIGERTNIGASTMFANYDGVSKNRSILGNDVKISCDTTIVAPVTIGDGAYTGAGTVVREDVPPGALAISMGRQRSLDGWADQHNAKKHKPINPSTPPQAGAS
ncbi:MAG: UDP-N-acetylglucosamine pyrophosphorylase [Pseudonocardiales bacterium]|nr:UDP-N-acetylglucosamine pyrophosphorylase [Pseudonocardiales bacterium]